MFTTQAAIIWTIAESLPDEETNLFFFKKRAVERGESGRGLHDQSLSASYLVIKPQSYLLVSFSKSSILIVRQHAE